jgi:hypothetical protein
VSSRGRFYERIAFASLLLFAGLAFAKDSKLRIHVEPKQAYIFIDGVPSGHGGRTIKLSAGNHSIGVYNYGFTSQVRDVSVAEGEVTQAEFTLQPVPGNVSGPWGRLQIEGASHSAILLTGKTPDYFVGHGDEFNHGGAFLPCCIQRLIVPPGPHTLTILDKGGHERWSGTVNVAANERLIFNANNGHQKVKAWPKGADTGPLSRFTAGIASATVAVAPVTASLTTQSDKINCGDSTQLAWTTGETVERAILSDTEKLKQSEATGNVTVRPLKTTKYDLQASGPGGTVTSSATVDVNTAVQSSLQASPNEIRYRRIGEKVLEQGSSNLTWSSSNASSVAIAPLGSVDANGSRSIQSSPTQQTNGPVNETLTYTLTAKNECGGSDTQTASLRIVGSIEPIPELPLTSVFFPTGLPDQRHPERGLVRSQQLELDKTAEAFKKYLEYDPDARLSVLGNTDERDSNARNRPLSERRANRVKEYLVSVGIPENKIETTAQGKDHPLDAPTVKLLHDQNPAKPAKSLGTFQKLVWAYNRRVDLVLEPKGERSTQYFPGTASEARLLFDSKWPENTQTVILASEKEKVPVQPDPGQK